MQDGIYVGIDVAKEAVDVALGPEEKVLTLPNSAAGFAKLLGRLKDFVVALVVMEATGGYERELADALCEAGHPVAVVNPRQVRDFARAMGVPAKTDRIDARVIARYAQAVNPPVRGQRTAGQRELAELVARRAQLMEHLTAESNRLRMVVSKRVRSEIGRAMAGLKRRVKTLDRDISDLIASDRALKVRSDLIQSVPGAGPQLAAALLAHCPELGTVSEKEIAALVGVAPLNRDSGGYSGRRTTWGGRSKIRSALYMSALVAAKHNPRIKNFYERLLDSGKPKKVALVACMRKLLVILNAMLRHGEFWRPEDAPAR